MSKIICCILLLNITLLACSPKKEKMPDAPIQQANEYPPIVLTFNDGKELSAKELKGNNVFVLFQPDCDHCQEEAIHIEQRLVDFKDYTLYFISSAPMENIMAFARNFKLHDKQNVRFAWTSTEGVLSHYGPIQTPSVYIYANGQLRQAFNGQTDIENIVQAL